MKRVLIAAILLGLLSLAVGCGDGVAITSRERQERHRRIMENDWKQLNDDWDSFWLMDRPGRLTWSRVE
ncbi:MAG: hypothetical protein GXY55_05775 [Phycisphaerae bacterium]|nr:hypothetical protein [Phycisphaerae bacterium]